MHTGGLVGNCTKGVEYGATREKDKRKTADVGEEVWCDSTCWREGEREANNLLWRPLKGAVKRRLQCQTAASQLEAEVGFVNIYI